MRAYGTPEPGKPAMFKVVRGGQHHWRALTPERERAVKEAHANGVSAPTLATMFGVTRRTIYRTLERADRPTVEVVVGDYRAMFEIDDDGTPVQVTPWVATVDNSGG